MDFLKIYILGAIINIVLLLSFPIISLFREKGRKITVIREISTIFIFVGYILSSFLSTILIIHGLLKIIGEDVFRFGVKKKNYVIYAIGKILCLEYNKDMFAYYMASYVLPHRKTRYKSSRYYKDVMFRYQSIKKHKK